MKMAENSSTVEVDEKLSLLKQNFLRELRKIAEGRLQLEKQTLSPIKESFQTESRFGRMVAHKTVRLESSVGEKLVHARRTADGLEDKLQETRIAFEDKLKTVDRMKAELDRREHVLINSIQELETYIRAVFYLKQDADNMLGPLQNTEDEQSRILRHLAVETAAWNNKKKLLSKAIYALRPAKLHLEEMISDLQDYLSTEHLVEYYLVLELLQEDLLNVESECAAAEEKLAADRQTMSEFKRSIPALLVSKESTLLDLKSKLRNLRLEMTQLEEQIDAATLGQVKDAAARYDIQKWIKKLYLASVEFRPPEKIAGNTLDMLDGIRDFMADALDIVERLKTEVH